MALIESLTGMGMQTAEEALSKLKLPQYIEYIDLTALELKKWRKSDIIHDMICANKYYLVQNTAIAEKKRAYKDAAGKTYVNDTLSNARIASGFLRTSINQKANYGFGKPFTINIERIEKDERDAQEDANASLYLTEWQNFFNTYARQVIKRIVKNSINNGIGWAYVWIDETTGQLKIIDVPSETIYPNWKDKAHAELIYLIRDYTATELNENEFAEIKKVEFWDAEVVERYIDDEGHDKPALKIDVEAEKLSELPNAIAHMIWQGQAISWGKIPFIALKGNDDELPLLNIIKEAIDAYDYLMSKNIDSLQDDLDPILVVEGMSSDVEMMKIARKTIQEHRLITVDPSNKAYFVQVKADMNASQQKLEHLRKDIREWSVTVDTQDVKFGSNPSGVALKAMYQDLDIYMDGLELEFEVFIENLKYFFDRWLQFKGTGNVELWEKYKVIVTLNRDMMVNLSEDVRNALELAKTNPEYAVSIETIDSFNPAIESHEIEEQRREAEMLKNKEHEMNSGDMNGFIAAAEQRIRRQYEQYDANQSAASEENM